MLVDRLGLIDGQVLNIKIGVAALADAPVSLTAGVCRVTGVATLMAEQSVEGLVEVHPKYSHATKANAKPENPTTIAAQKAAKIKSISLSLICLLC